MPFYNLKCNSCGREFEKYAAVSEKDDICCPECGEKKLTTLFGNKGAAVIIKDSKNAAETCPNAHICGGCCKH